jgi:thiamine biosynthesis lipoprotein
MQYHEFRSMNTGILLAAEGSRQQVAAGFQQAQRLVEQCESRFTRFSEASELMALNRAAGSWFAASAELFEVVQDALHMANATDGLFNPAVLPTLRSLGYDRSMDELTQAGPFEGPLPPLPQTPDFRRIELDPARKVIHLPSGMQIDLGGIAKGWIAERAAQTLAESCQTCAVNAGGDMFLVGLPAGQATWEIGLENPRDPAQDYAVLQISPGALATSTITKRTWRRGGQAHHHLIDPRTGESADTNWLSVTVQAPHAYQAEAFAKAFLIAGRDARSDPFLNQPQTAFLAIDRQGSLWGSANSSEVFHVTGQNIL